MTSRIIHPPPRIKRTCIFCGAPAKSKEHAWPDWLVKLLNTLSGQPVTNIYAEQDGQPWANWRGVNASIRVKATCKPCNEGWMSELEHEVKPILDPLIRDTPVMLSATQRLIVSTWAVKTSMIFDFVRSPNNPYFHPAQTTHLFRSRTPPPTTFGVWLGRYVGDNLAFTAGKTLNGFDLRTGRTIKGNVQTMTFRAMVIQTINVRMPKGQTITGGIDLDTVPGKWHQSTIRLWPVELKSLQWPPSLTLDDTESAIDTFANRFTVPPQ